MLESYSHDTHIKIEPMINPIEVKWHKMNETWRKVYSHVTEYSYVMTDHVKVQDKKKKYT